MRGGRTITLRQGIRVNEAVARDTPTALMVALQMYGTEKLIDMARTLAKLLLTSGDLTEILSERSTACRSMGATVGGSDRSKRVSRSIFGDLTSLFVMRAWLPFSLVCWITATQSRIADSEPGMLLVPTGGKLRSAHICERCCKTFVSRSKVRPVARTDGLLTVAA